MARKPYTTFTGPHEPVMFRTALRLCRSNRLWCMRPWSMNGLGNGVGYRVRDGVIVPMGDFPFPLHVATLLGQWEVMAISAFEREVIERETGVQL